MAYILSACRTPIGSFMGSLSTIHASNLGAIVIKESLQRVNVNDKSKLVVDEVIMGHVLTAGEGQNTARQASIHAGISNDVPAFAVNHVCGSGLKSVALAAQSVLAGDAKNIIVAGGMENMSLAPHVVPNSRSGQRMGHWEMKDTMINDGLWCAFNDYHMGITAENIGAKYNISRAEQDEFAAKSQQKAQDAIKAGRFNKEIVSVTIPNKKQPIVFSKDEFPKAGVTVEGLAKLRAAFQKGGGVTAGNASGINDGAAAVTVASEAFLKSNKVAPIARIAGYAMSGVDPAVMGLGPIQATKRALAKAGWKVSDLDLIEANEAFAAQSIAVCKDLEFDPAKVNVNGGAIALGHPIGASGTRVLVTLLHEMERRNAKKGLATLCIGGGQGIALAVERN